MEYIVFDVIVKGLFTDAQFGMCCHDLKRGLSLIQQGLNDAGHGSGLLGSKVDALSGIGQGSAVIHPGIFRAVLVFVKTATGPAGAAIAGAGRAVTSGTVEGAVLRTVRGALAVKNTFTVVIAFQGHLTFMGKGPVESDLFTDSRLVFTDGLCNGRFSGTIDDAGKDDTSFIQSEMGKSIRIIRIIHMLPAFPAAAR